MALLPVGKPKGAFSWRCALRREDGNVLLVTGVLMALLLFASLGYSALYYFNYQSEVDGVAEQVASYGATFLPDPEQAVARAAEAFQVFSRDFRTGGSRFSIDTSATRALADTDPKLRLFVRAMRTTNGVPVCKIVTGPRDCFDDFEYLQAGGRWIAQKNDKGQDLGLPIESIKARIEVTYKRFLKLNMIGLPNMGTIQISSTAAGRLTPTDVMLVIENSNSTVSQIADNSTGSVQGDRPLDGEPPSPPLEFPGPGGTVMGAWGQRFGIHDSDTDKDFKYDHGNLPPMTKSEAVMRSCFGEVSKDIKEAALRIFDTLSASSTFRVGVIHTMNFGGETPEATVKITNYSFLLNYIPRTGDGQPTVKTVTGQTNTDLQDSIDLPRQLQANRGYLVTDYPETRCAALLSQPYFALPPHPISDQSEPKFVWENLTNPVPDFNLNLANGNGGSGTARILPRDLIWIANSGYNYQSGDLNPKYDFSQTQFALTRAIDLLRNASKRADNVPVRRRQVILLTDGFEKPGSDFRPTGPLSDFTSTRKGDPGMIEEAFAESNNGAGLQAGAISVLKNYCSDSQDEGYAPGKNPVFNNTKIDTGPDKNSDGVRLSILYYNSRGKRVNNDFFEPIMDLPGHSEDGSGIDEFRSDGKCNTKWSSSTGRTLMLVDPEVVRGRIVSSANGKKSPAIGPEYTRDLAPAVIRSLMTSEVSVVQ